MQDVVGSNFHSKLFGKGLPEQMRSTAFAFLGLTAAGALTLVAIFAQLSFPLLSPVPLPAEPAEEGRIGDGVALAGERLTPPRRGVASPATPRSGARGAEQSSGAPVPAAAPTSGGDGSVSQPADKGANPAPSPPAPSSPPAQPAPSADPPDRAPPAAPEPAPAPAPAPKPTPPAEPAPVPPSPVPTPPPPVAQRPAVPATAAASPPAHSNAGGNGKGNAYGHSK